MSCCKTYSVKTSLEIDIRDLKKGYYKIDQNLYFKAAFPPSRKKKKKRLQIEWFRVISYMNT